MSTCIITGSASGIGAATVMALASEGYHTFGIDLNGEGAQNVALQAELEHLEQSHRACADDNGIPPAHAVNINYIEGQRQPRPCAPR